MKGEKEREKEREREKNEEKRLETQKSFSCPSMMMIIDKLLTTIYLKEVKSYKAVVAISKAGSVVVVIGNNRWEWG